MSRNNKHTSFLILFLSSLILMFVGCQKSPEQAKKELTEMKIDFSEESFIMYAAYNDLKVVKLFLQAGMNPNSEMNGITALAAALFGNSELAAKEIVKNSPTINSIPEQTCRIFEKRIKMIELLIEHGADVNFYSKDGTSLLMGAATLQIYPIVYQCLLKLNPNTKNYKALNIMTKDMTPQIESYLTEQLIAVVKIFLKHNLDPNHVNNLGLNALMLASMRGRLDIVKLLLANNANINHTSEDSLLALSLGLSPKNSISALSISLKSEHPATALYLIESGADFDLVVENEPLLIYATKKDYVNVVAMLIQKGQEVDILNDYGESALFYACAKDNIRIAKILLEHGANVNLEYSFRDHPKKNPLTRAIGTDNVELVSLLIANGAKYKSGLDKAVNEGYTEIVKSLLELGANPNELDSRTRPMLNIAAYMGRLEIVKLLLDKGADVNMKDRYTQTPLMVAIDPLIGYSENSLKITQLLISHGANVNAKYYRDRILSHFLKTNGGFKKLSGEKLKIYNLLVESGAKK